MAQKRMFDKSIIRTDRFLDMSPSTQNLYFHLGMEADDEGFVSPKMVMRTLGAGDDELRILIAKNFIIPFESGVVVITDWNANNYLNAIRIKPTQHKEERKTLFLTENNKYEFNKNRKMLRESSIEESSVVESNTPSDKSEEGDFSMKEELKKLHTSERKNFKIIGLYISRKGFVFQNKLQFNKEFRRNLKAAKCLLGYSGKEVDASIDYCIRKYPEIWTLETVAKMIPEIINK